MLMNKLIFATLCFYRYFGVCTTRPSCFFAFPFPHCSHPKIANTTFPYPPCTATNYTYALLSPPLLVLVLRTRQQVETVMENSRGETLAEAAEEREGATGGGRSPGKVTFSEEVRVTRVESGERRKRIQDKD